MLDGVYRCDADELHTLLQAVIARLMKLLTRRGVLVEDMGQTCLAEPDTDGERARTLQPLQAAVTYRISFGPRAGQKVLTLDVATWALLRAVKTPMLPLRAATENPAMPLPDGLIVVAKRECPTCTLVEPLLARLADGGDAVTVLVQDDPAYAAGVPGAVFDSTLEQSFRLGIEFVPTLIRMQGGREVARTHGWHRGDWQEISRQPGLGADLPELRPGCASKTLDPGIADELQLRFGHTGLTARNITLGDAEDPMEACHDRGWTDGLPVVPPTPARVLRMLTGTSRRPDEVLGLVPPDLAACTVEKVAINAVMAGCKPEYMPLVLAAVEAALIDEFGMHGVLCTTMFCGPLVLVNGPLGRAVGVNSGVNALGQGHRANASIGRALQLVIRKWAAGGPARSTAPRWARPANTASALPRPRSPSGNRCMCNAASRAMRPP